MLLIICWMNEGWMKAFCVHYFSVYSIGMMIPNDIQGPGLLVEMSTMAQRRRKKICPYTNSPGPELFPRPQHTQGCCLLDTPLMHSMIFFSFTFSSIIMKQTWLWWHIWKIQKNIFNKTHYIRQYTNYLITYIHKIIPYIQFFILGVACKMDYIEYLLRKWEVDSLFLTT